MNFHLLFAPILFLAIHQAYSDYLLPTDAVNFLDAPLRSQFRCVKTGYFADIDNNCQMYHVCVVQRKATGHQVIRQYSFVCGNGTIFNQLTMTCDDPQEALPCEDAPRYYNMNRKFGEPNTWFHNGNDYIEDYEEPGFGDESSDYYVSASDASSAVYALPPSTYGSSIYASSNYAPSSYASSYIPRSPVYAFRPTRYRYPTYDLMDSYLDTSESIERPVVYPIATPRRHKPNSEIESVSRTPTYSMTMDAPGIYTFPRKRNPKYGLL